MAAQENQAASHQQLEQVLAEYLRGEEAGCPPDRDELLQQHPELAADLRAFFHNRDAMQRFANALHEQITIVPRAPADSAASSSGPTRVRYFGDYELLEEIARGGMGIVYKARQSSLKRIVAVKMILTGEFAGKDDVRRFYVEAEAAARLDHPNIVPIYEIGAHDGQHYFSMAYIQGQSLARSLATAVMPPRQAATLMKTVSEAIAYAHIEGVVHRDLKPGNIILDQDGQPHVSDFGLAKRLHAETEITRTGQILGTPSYLPPEQAQGHSEQIGPLSDVYALGAVLYCLLTGRPPYQAATPAETLHQVVHRPCVPPRQLNAAVPQDLDTICQKCLEKSPQHRYASAQELADELQRYLNGEPIRARPISSFERFTRWCRRNPIVSTLAAALLLALVVGFAGITTQWMRAETQSQRAEQQERLTELHLYAAHMLLAHESWKSNDVARLEPLLDEWQVDDERQDLRGWEWHYLKSLRDRDKQVIDAHSFGNAVSFHPNQLLVASAGMSTNEQLRADQRGMILNIWNTQNGTLEDQWPLRTSSDVTALAYRPDGTQLACAAGNKVTVFDVRGDLQIAFEYVDEKEISALTWSGDGKRLAVGGLSGNIQLLNSDTGDVERLLQGHTAWIKSLSFQADGSKLVSAAQDATARIWHLVDDAANDYSLAGGPGAVCFHPDGQHVIQAQDDHSLHLWNLLERRVVRRFTGHTGPVTAVKFSKDGSRAASASWDRTIRVWETNSGRELLLLQGHRGIVRDIDWDPHDLQLVSTGVDGTVRLWVAAGEQHVTMQANQFDVMTLAWSPDSKMLAAGNADNTVRLWDVYQRKLVQTLEGHQHHVLSACFHPSTGLLATADRERNVILWNAESGAEVWKLAGAGIHMAWHPDATHLFTWPADVSSEIPLVAREPAVAFWDVTQQSSAKLLIGNEKTPVTGRSLACSADGRWLANEDAGGVRLWNLQSGAEVWFAPGKKGPLLFSPDGQRLCMGAEVWNVQQQRQTGKLSIGETEPSAWSPDGRRLVAVTPDAVHIFDAETCEEVWRMRVAAPRTARWSPNGRWLAVGDQHGKIHLLSAELF